MAIALRSTSVEPSPCPAAGLWKSGPNTTIVAEVAS